MTSKSVDLSLSRIYFKTFKAFHDAVVNLAPITVVAGVNSSGKSSILQGLLVLRNTLATRNIRQKDTPLIYEKPLPFTEFEELVFGYPVNDLDSSNGEWHEITLGLDIPLHVTAHPAQKYFGQCKEAWCPLVIGIEACFGRQDRRQSVTIRSVTLRATPADDDTSTNTLSLLFEPQKNSQCKITYQFRGQKLQIEQYVEFDHFLPNLEGRGRPSRKDGEAKAEIYNAYTDLFSLPLFNLRDQLTRKFHYIGPLRSAPEPAVIQQQIDGLDVGTAGEKTIQLLYDRIEEGKAIHFVRIPKKLTDFNLNNLEPTELDLETALQDALRLMGIEQRLRIQKQGVSYQASVSLHYEDGFVPITDVGFGISQVLPIVAVCLLAEQGDLLVFEQPEIHLHPRAQAGLADLLLCTALSGKQVVIETHSDHLINRLRRRLAEDQSNRLANQVRIVFVSPPVAAGQGAVVEQARINEIGDIENWPEGFLAESPSEAGAILRASLQKISDQPEFDHSED